MIETMIQGWDPTEIVACALRPQGSWLHLLTLLGFVLAAWSVSPKVAPPASVARVRSR